jgi:hypothetical protein
MIVLPYAARNCPQAVKAAIVSRFQLKKEIQRCQKVTGSLGATASRCVARSEPDRQRSNDSKIWNVPGYPELSCDVEQRPRPHDCAEANVNGAQYSIRVWHDEVREVRIGEVSYVEAGRN